MAQGDDTLDEEVSRADTSNTRALEAHSRKERTTIARITPIKNIPPVNAAVTVQGDEEELQRAFSSGFSAQSQSAGSTVADPELFSELFLLFVTLLVLMVVAAVVLAVIGIAALVAGLIAAISGGFTATSIALLAAGLFIICYFFIF